MALNESGTANLASAGAGELDVTTAPRADANPHNQVGPSPGHDEDLPQLTGQSSRQADMSDNPIGSAAADGHTTD